MQHPLAPAAAATAPALLLPLQRPALVDPAKPADAAPPLLLCQLLLLLLLLQRSGLLLLLRLNLAPTPMLCLKLAPLLLPPQRLALSLFLPLQRPCRPSSPQPTPSYQPTRNIYHFPSSSRNPSLRNRDVTTQATRKARIALQSVASRSAAVSLPAPASVRPPLPITETTIFLPSTIDTNHMPWGHRDGNYFIPQ